MVDQLVRDGLVRSTAIEAAFRSVPRHWFLPGVAHERVYAAEEAVVTRATSEGFGLSSSSAPSIMAIMLEQLRLEPGHQVLEIGAGTGYNAALVATVVGQDGAVVTVDIDPDVAREARRALQEYGFDRVVVVVEGDGWLGLQARGPYDRIVATVGVPGPSPHWVEQLREGGVLVAPVQLRPGLQLAAAFTRHGDRLEGRDAQGCGFMRLRGPHAGAELAVAAPGWFADTDGLSAAEAATLVDFLGTPPRRRPVPALPEGWAARLALEWPGAARLAHLVHLVRPENWRRRAMGLFDAASGSLALVDDGEGGPAMLVFGSEAAGDGLAPRLAGLAPLDVGLLRVSAVPSGTVPPRAGTYVLPRQGLDLVVRERSGPAGP